jgi:hypothetical protein
VDRRKVDAVAHRRAPDATPLITSGQIATLPGTMLHQDVFAIAQDGQLYSRTWSGGAWQPWTAIGRPGPTALSTSAPGVLIPFNNGPSLFAVGQDGQLYRFKMPKFS